MIGRHVGAARGVGALRARRESGVLLDRDHARRDAPRDLDGQNGRAAAVVEDPDLLAVGDAADRMGAGARLGSAQHQRISGVGRHQVDPGRDRAQRAGKAMANHARRIGMRPATSADFGGAVAH
jgi:hypothetical protein